MKLTFNPQKLTISDRLKKRIETKFETGLGKYLKHYQEDLKLASLAIEKVSRSGYEIKFDMNLPACPIHIKDNHKVLLDGIIRVRNKANRQVRKNIGKLRDR
jgi:ribosome-associated translation inhibitor RaiA